jgi:hypothetical protein
VYQLRFCRRLCGRRSSSLVIVVDPLLRDHTEAADAFLPPYDAIAPTDG